MTTPDGIVNALAVALAGQVSRTPTVRLFNDPYAQVLIDAALSRGCQLPSLAMFQTHRAVALAAQTTTTWEPKSERKPSPPSTPSSKPTTPARYGGSKTPKKTATYSSDSSATPPGAHRIEEARRLNDDLVAERNRPSERRGFTRGVGTPPSP
ncbi:MAG: hypothetical protein SV966_09095 [Actinomycetota bacterium]|nr:hypothetical protein [Actinomycetota bacterium]